MWAKMSPVAPKGGLNMQIEGNKIKLISPQPLEIPKNGYVISAPAKVIQKLSKNREIYIEIKLQENLKNAKHIIGAGPYLVKDSQIYVDYQAQKLSAISGKNPRSAIGYSKDGRIVIMTIDGREQASVGVTLNELAYLMKKAGCDYAMNFDGGSSSALYVKGKIVNSAVNKEGIAVSNALTVVENNPDELIISGI